LLPSGNLPLFGGKPLQKSRKNQIACARRLGAIGTWIAAVPREALETSFMRLKAQLEQE